MSNISLTDNERDQLKAAVQYYPDYDDPIFTTVAAIVEKNIKALKANLESTAERYSVERTKELKAHLRKIQDERDSARAELEELKINVSSTQVVGPRYEQGYQDGRTKGETEAAVANSERDAYRDQSDEDQKRRGQLVLDLEDASTRIAELETELEKAKKNVQRAWKSTHNHMTRDVKPEDQCAGCDWPRLKEARKRITELEAELTTWLQLMSGEELSRLRTILSNYKKDKS
jgi:hypothetical protein